jgi:hypothetical protein
MATEEEMRQMWQELQKELDAELADWGQAVERAMRERSGTGPREPKEE